MLEKLLLSAIVTGLLAFTGMNSSTSGSQQTIVGSNDITLSAGLIATTEVI